MAGVWLAFFVLFSFQLCEEVEAVTHSVLEVQHANPDDPQGLHHDFFCQPQISTHDAFANLSLNGSGIGLYKLAIFLFLPIAFLLPVLSRESGALPDRREFPPPRSNPFLSTIRLLI